MLPSDRTIVRFSFACLLLSMAACLAPFALDDSAEQDGVSPPMNEQAATPADVARGSEGKALEPCATTVPICDAP